MKFGPGGRRTRERIYDTVAWEKIEQKKLSFEKYQEESWKTAIYKSKGSNWVYPVLGLGGESGEVLEKFKKILRDDDGKILDEKKDLIKKELGDVLWYVAAICSELGISMSEVAKLNMEKLQSRKNRGKLKGSGDSR